MNEELKIIIKAVADEAKKELARVKEEIANVNKEAEKANKVSETIKNIGKAATVAVASVAALTTAMANLGKSAMEAQKAQARLESGFISAGSSAEQAKKTYEGLYRFLGDVDQATEASNLLARLTQDEEDLAEWTKILQGVYATFPDSLPVESLAEAANETAKTGEITGALADALNWAGVSEDAFAASLAACNSEAEREALIRGTLNSLYGGASAIYEQTNASTLAYNESQAQLHSTLAQASTYLTPLLTNLSNLAATLLQVLGPALQVVSAILITFIQWIVAAAKAIGSFFGAFKGEGTKATKEVSNSVNGVKTSIGGATKGVSGLGGALKDATKQAKELKKQTMGFDELNVMSPQSSASASGGGDVSAPSVEVPSLEIPEVEIGEIDMSGWSLEDFESQLANVKERMEGVLVLVGLVGAALIGWGIAEIISDFDTYKGKLKDISTTAGLIAASLVLIQSYSDAWANGIDWGNLALILGSIGAIVALLVVKFGPLAGAIGLVVGGIAMVVLGVKDLIENGYSMEAVIMVAVGVIAILIGVIWALNAALLANPITWIVVAIVALIAIFVILWNECDGFRQFWIDLWEGIKTAFAAIVDWFKQAGEDIAQFFVGAWEAIKSAWSAVKQWFSNIWQGIKDVFSAVGKWFSDIFTGAWNGIKKAFDSVKSFFSGIWDGIKNAFSKVGSWFKDTFSKAWQGVKDVFSTGGKIFDGIKDGISNVFKTVVNGIIGGINKVIKVPFDAINGMLNKIRNVEVVGVKPFQNFWKQDPLSVPQIPKLAKGGVVDSATLAIIGERGKEAVMPLENNTEWMDSLADKIASRNNTPSKIVLMLDGRELGWANINSINSITKQTGALQLALY